MKTFFVITAVFLSLAWIGFAWIVLSWLGFVLPENSIADFTGFELAICAATLVLAPISLVVGWSYLLQGTLPTRRQLDRLTLVLALALVGISVIVGFAVLVGLLKNATPLWR